MRAMTDHPGRPDPRGRRLFVAALTILGFLAAGAMLPRHPEYDFLFGFEAYRDLGFFSFAAAATLIVLIFSRPRLSARVASLLGRVGRIPLGLPLLVLLSGVAFILLTNVRLSGDATSIVLMTGLGRVTSSNSLTCFLHQVVDAMPGMTAHDGVRLVSVASGLIYVPCAVGIARQCFRDGPRRVALSVLLLTATSVVLFFGSIEVYAPLTAFLALYLLVGIRHLKGRGRGVLPPLIVGTAFCLHGSAGLLIPSLVLLANDGRIRPLRVKRWFVWGGIFLVPVVVVFVILFFGVWGGTAPDVSALRYGNFFGGNGQGPFLPLVRSPENLTHRYALFDLEHLIGVLNLYVLASPIGLTLLLLGRPRRRGVIFRWIAVVAALLVVFPIFWNVNYALRRDWDLFSPMGVPIALLGGLAFLRLGGGRRRIVGVCSVALLTFVPIVIGSVGLRSLRREYAIATSEALAKAAEFGSGERADENRVAAEEWMNRARNLDVAGPTLEQAERLAAAHRPAEAEVAYRRVLDIDPGHPTAASALGLLLCDMERHDEARIVLERAIRRAPNSFLPRWRLALSYIDERRDDEAIVHLERAVRHAAIDDRILEALRILEYYWRKKGETERAAAMERLALERLAMRGR
jgi:Tetratricopeptide repeat